MQKPFQDEWSKAWDAMERAMTLENKSELFFWIFLLWVLPAQAPRLCDFLQNHFVDRLTSAGYLIERLRFSPSEPSDFWETPLYCLESGLWSEPPHQVLRQLINHPGAPPNLRPSENKVFFFFLQGEGREEEIKPISVVYIRYCEPDLTLKRSVYDRKPKICANREKQQHRIECSALSQLEDEQMKRNQQRRQKRRSSLRCESRTVPCVGLEAGTEHLSGMQSPLASACERLTHPRWNLSIGFSSMQIIDGLDNTGFSGGLGMGARSGRLKRTSMAWEGSSVPECLSSLGKVLGSIPSIAK